MTQKEKQYYEVNYPELTRKYDSAAVFILKGRRLLCDGGHLTYISSITWQTGENYSLLRKTLFTKAGIKLIINLPFDIFKSAYVDTGIYLISAKPSLSYEIYCYPKTANELKLESLVFQAVPLSLVDPPDYKIILNLFASMLLKKITTTRKIVTLGNISISTQGLAGSAYKIKPQKTSQSDFPFLISGQVYRYVLENPGIGYTDMKDRPSLTKFYNEGHKILIRRVINRQDRLMATVIEEQLVFKKDVNPFLIIDSRFNSRFVLALINTAILNLEKGLTKWRREVIT